MTRALCAGLLIVAFAAAPTSATATDGQSTKSATASAKKKKKKKVVRGKKGDRGAKGDKGDRGAKGDKGDRGEKGVKGDKGDAGPAGTSGVLNIQVVTSASTPVEGGGVEGAKADCPVGTRVIAGGITFDVDTGLPPVADMSVPVSALSGNGWLVIVVSKDVEVGYFQAQAICVG